MDFRIASRVFGGGLSMLKGVSQRTVAWAGNLVGTGVLIQAQENGTVRLAATDGEVSMVVRLEAHVEEVGGVVVPYATLHDYVESIPDVDLRIRLVEPTKDGSPRMCVQWGRRQATFVGSPAEEFPLIPDGVTDEGMVYEVSGIVVREAVEGTSFSCGREEQKPVMTGLHVRVGDDELLVETADGVRMTRVLRDVSAAEVVGCIVPLKAMKKVADLVGDEQIRVELTDTQAIFELPVGTVVSQLVEGNFPDLSRVIQGEIQTRVVVDKKPLVAALRTVNVFARKGNQAVGMSVSKSAVTLSSSPNGEVGEVEVKIDAEVDGKAEVSFNAGFLLQAVEKAPSKRVILGLRGSDQSAKLLAVEDPGWVHVLMPVQLRGSDAKN